MTQHTLVDTFFARFAHCLEAYHVSEQSRHPFDQGVRRARIRTRRSALDPLPAEPKRKRTFSLRRCVHCPKHFTPIRVEQKYCSPKCRTNANNERHMKKKRVNPAHFENLKAARNKKVIAFRNDPQARVPRFVGRPSRNWINFVREQLHHVKKVRERRAAFTANLPTPFGPGDE